MIPRLEPPPLVYHNYFSPSYSLLLIELLVPQQQLVAHRWLQSFQRIDEIVVANRGNAVVVKNRSGIQIFE